MNTITGFIGRWWYGIPTDEPEDNIPNSDTDDITMSQPSEGNTMVPITCEDDQNAWQATNDKYAPPLSDALPLGDDDEEKIASNISNVGSMPSMLIRQRSMPPPIMSTIVDDSDGDGDELMDTFDTMEDELQYLRRQNTKLKHKLKQSRVQRVSRPNITPAQLSELVQARLPAFIRKADADANPSVSFVPSNFNLDEMEGANLSQSEGNMVNYPPQIDWWSIVEYGNQNAAPPASTSDATVSDAVASAMTTDMIDTTIATPIDGDIEHTTAPTDEFVSASDTAPLSGPFILLRESDVVDAIAYFIAQCVVRLPECKDLSNEQMLDMLDGTFAQLRKKGPLGAMWEWSAFVYAAYGWTKYCWLAYDNPVVAKVICTCLWSAACWMIAV